MTMNSATETLVAFRPTGISRSLAKRDVLPETSAQTLVTSDALDALAKQIPNTTALCAFLPAQTGQTESLFVASIMELIGLLPRITPLLTHSRQQKLSSLLHQEHL